MEPIEVELTCPDAETARAIVRAAVESRLAACGWVFPGMEAVYRWQGAVESGAEVLVRLKSRRSQFDALCAVIRARHPYDLPAITAIPVAALGPGVGTWWAAETGAPQDDAPG